MADIAFAEHTERACKGVQAAERADPSVAARRAGQRRPALPLACMRWLRPPGAPHAGAAIIP